MYTVKLDYFKETGKWYAQGEYTTKVSELHFIWDEVEEKIEERCLPGLIQGHSNFIVSVDVPMHPYNHPHLIIPDKE